MSTVAKVAVVGKECICILSVIAGNTICTFIFEEVLNEASIVESIARNVQRFWANPGHCGLQVTVKQHKRPNKWNIPTAHCSPFSVPSMPVAFRPIH